MAEVELKLPHHAYRIVIEPGLLGRLGAQVREVAPHDRAAVLADERVFAIHGEAASRSMRQAGYDCVCCAVAMGEENKNYATVEKLQHELLNARLERRSPVVALGGGVAGDTVGFVAATYLRGVPFIQCPTTLLAMVDASVGGKVGINMPQGKNLIGAFYQPRLVMIDTDTLATLPMRELRCGLAECVKHAIIRDEKLFDWLEDNLDAISNLESETLVELVQWNVRIKAAVVMEDEKETGVRAHLNFGHTFAHAIEAVQRQGQITAAAPTEDGFYHHGEAVALGMVAATQLAVAAGRVDAFILERLRALLDRIGLPTKAHNLPMNETLIETMHLDKKVADQRIRLVLPDALGQVSLVNDTPARAIADAWDALR